MTTQQIADRLVQLCSKGDFETAQKELFAENAVSIEPHATPSFAIETKGLKAIKEKGEKWNLMVKETHGMEVSEPLVAGSSFACTMRFMVTMKESGYADMKELCIYKVKDGKIISEEFIM